LIEKKWLESNARKKHQGEGALVGGLVVVGAWQTRERIAHLTEVVKYFAVNGRNRALNGDWGDWNAGSRNLETRNWKIETEN
jgi:hypothetical protein